MKSIFDLKLDDLTLYLESHGYSKFVSKQIYDWIYKKRVFDFDKMSNLKIDLRELLKQGYVVEHIDGKLSKVEKDQSRIF